MKNRIFLVLFSLTLMSGECKKASTDCHYYIYIKNNSQNAITVAIRIPGADGRCRLDGEIVDKGATHAYRPYNFCIESSMLKNATEDIYIVDPKNYTETFSSCDSVEINNKVLKHYVLTLNDLSRSNFTITYP
ncbi:hypothetical protein [Mucilaginibacter panaciglaebae]|uniref:Uncharacterized protein n=1 Tax=Mucilaginibacter panaciglaebae TaxID=502331 RepID=A0ABP7X4M6_9SPHI